MPRCATHCFILPRSVQKPRKHRKAFADAGAAPRENKRKPVDANLEQEKKKSPKLAQHTKKKKYAPDGNPPPATNRTPQEASALLQKTEQISSDQKTVASLGKR